MVEITNIPQLVINRLTQEQYDELLKNGEINESELYLTDGDGGSSSGTSLPEQLGNEGKFLTTDGENASWNYTSVIKDTSTETGLPQLIINRLTQEEYNELVANGQVKDNELYLTEGEISSGDSLPEQSGNENKALVTDGENASWDYTSIFKNINEGTENGSSQIIVNQLTQAKYEELLANNQIVDNQLYITTDDETSDVSLPDQTNNQGKFLTTDGTNAYWEDVGGVIIRDWSE